MNTILIWSADLPSDHAARVERMRLSLDALGLGDALGEMLSYQAQAAPQRLAENNLPAGPWFHTDDTEMAISICAILKSHGFLHQDALAKRFARRFERDPGRGYGSMTRIQMCEIMAGAKWRDTAANAFGGQGSMGNGSAMRVAPLGAYFADDLGRCAEQAQASSLVTHTHPEGVPVAGETTCALAVVTPDAVFGASVGDSAVWMIPQRGGHLDLTNGQQRKPLIGSGSAWPVPFRRPKPGGTLLLATDGLLRYASAERILAICREHPAHLAAQRLIELVRYPSGALPDDVTVILAGI